MTRLSFTHKELRKNVKVRQRRTWYNPVSWIVDDGRCCRMNTRKISKSLKFYRDEGYLDIKVSIGHGADKVLASPEYEALRTKLFQARASHAQTVEDLDDAERGWKILGRMMTSASWIAWLKRPKTAWTMRRTLWMMPRMTLKII